MMQGNQHKEVAEMIELLAENDFWASNVEVDFSYSDDGFTITDMYVVKTESGGDE